MTAQVERLPGETPLEDDVEAEKICEVLGDERSLRIIRTLEQASDGLTAGTLADRAEIPTSTVYRKMDAITATPLVVGSVAIGEDGPQATRYEVGVDAVRLSFTEDEIDVEVDQRADDDVV